MSNYTKSTNFAAKDSLPSGNANKVVKGTEINTEFDNIATAIATKADLNSPTLVTPNLGTPSAAVLTNATGLPLTTGVTGTLPVANGGTGATTFSAGALLKGVGTSAITTATAGTDYAPATSGTAILKGNGTGGFSNAAAGTDYAAATTGTSAQLLANNGSGGFSNVTVGSGLSLSAGTLSTTGGASISAGDSNVTVSDTGSNGTVTVQTDGSERMRITNTGLVGIGTSSPLAKLDVRGAPGADYGIANVFDTTTAALGVGGVLALSGYKTSTTGAAIFSKIKGIKENATSGNEAGVLVFETNSGSAYTERMRIDSSGNVGIGTSSPSYRFDVSGASASGIARFANAWGDGTNPAILVDGTGSDGRLVQIKSGGTRSWPLLWVTASTTDVLVVNGDSTIKTAGTISVGGATPSTSGAGITFPATQSASSDANTLDDYEEGTWTPTQGAGITLVGSFSSTGTYTKIGNIVTLRGRLSGSTSLAITAASVLCGGLPFTPSGDPYAMGSMTNSAVNTSATVFVVSASRIDTAGTFSATPTLYFSVTYQI